MSLSKLRELMMDREAWHATVHGGPDTTEWLNGTELLTQITKEFGQRQARRWCNYQVSVDEAVSLQVLHPFTHILTHAQQHVSAEMALSLPEEIQKAAPLHELSDNVNGLLLRANTIKLY